MSHRPVPAPSGYHDPVTLWGSCCASGPLATVVGLLNWSRLDRLRLGHPTAFLGRVGDMRGAW